MAYCKIFLKSFRIDSSGISQVKSHEKCHKPGQTLSNQRTLKLAKIVKLIYQKKSFVLSPEEQVTKAEILQAFIW